MGGLKDFCSAIVTGTYTIIFPIFSVIFQHSCISEWWVLLIINIILNPFIIPHIYYQIKELNNSIEKEFIYLIFYGIASFFLNYFVGNCFIKIKSKSLNYLLFDISFIPGIFQIFLLIEEKFQSNFNFRTRVDIKIIFL
jgi:hypothetical protein